MTILHARESWRLFPAAALAALLFQGEAGAAFTVSLNGSQVAVDNGVNDTNPLEGVITFDVMQDGWRVRLTGRTTFSTDAVGSLQLSELLVERLTSGSPNSLVVDIGESAFLTPNEIGLSVLSATLTRNRIGSLGTSGKVGLTSTAADLNGNTAVATTPTLTPNPPAQGSGEPTTAFFDRETRQYSLRSVVIVKGLGVGHGVSVTADASVIEIAPAPSPAVMLLGGLPFLALVRRPRRSE